MRKNKFLYILSALVLSFVFSRHASAATIGFKPDTGTYKVGDTISIRVTVASDSRSVNGVSGLITFPKNVLTLASISKTSSIIDLWAQDPSISNSDGTASFEGVILNGYTGGSGTVVTLIFKAKASGVASLAFRSAQILANDGNGTDILTGKGTATLTVQTATSVEVSSSPAQTPVKSTTITISEIKNTDQTDTQKKVIITPPDAVKDNLYSVVIDAQDPIAWVDDGSHIFTLPELSNGSHIMNVTATSKAKGGDTFTGTLKFTAVALKVPTVTYAPQEVYSDQFLVVKGIADPNVDVEVTLTNTKTSDVAVSHVHTNTDGAFTFVPDQMLPKGAYTITLVATNKDGIQSDASVAFTVSSVEHSFSLFAKFFTNYLSIATPLLALLALLVVVAIYGFYHVRRAHKYITHKLSSTENLVAKSFEILEEDADEEIAIFKKIKAGKALTKQEAAFLSKFKKDIKSAEAVIKAEVKSIKK